MVESPQVTDSKSNAAKAQAVNAAAQSAAAADQPEQQFADLLAQIFGSGVNIDSIRQNVPIVKLAQDNVSKEQKEVSAPKAAVKNEKVQKVESKVVTKQETQDKAKDTVETAKPEADTQAQAQAAATVSNQPVQAKASEDTPVQVTQQAAQNTAAAAPTETAAALTAEEQTAVTAQIDPGKARAKVTNGADQTVANQVNDQVQAVETTVQEVQSQDSKSAGRAKVTSEPLRESPTLVLPADLNQDASTEKALDTTAASTTQVKVDLAAASLQSAAQALGAGSVAGGLEGVLAKQSVTGLESTAKLNAMGAWSSADLRKESAAESSKGGSAQKLPGAVQAKIIERIKEIATEYSVNKSADSITVRLNPPELGEMTVKITQRGGHLFARIIPDSPEVEDTIKSKSHEISQILTIAGVKADNIHVSVGKEPTEADLTAFSQFLGSGKRGYSQEQESKQGGVPYQNTTPQIADISTGPASSAAEDAGWVA